MLVDIEKLKPQIVEKLKPLNPDKIILFGSYAYGTPTDDSDIDLYVVTNDNFMPQSWRAKSDLYLEYSTKLRDLQKDIPIDLIVHTEAMHNKFLDMDSMFSRKILNSGILLT
ncbi:MAG: nucleotidyltransferase domain-containing protein [Helicobacteraceae bacterium]|nr:nucleotidyltransferase domain-containing protein [Helicobacteraceae bacterium]